MKKDFDKWNEVKKSVNEKPDNFGAHEREIWWVSLGINVGVEIDGKSEDFERPVLILRKFNRQMVWVLPTTSQGKDARFYEKFSYGPIQSFACGGRSYSHSTFAFKTNLYKIRSIFLKFNFCQNMALIKRYLEEKILKNLGKKKILIIYGARQVGKTTMVKNFLNGSPKSVYLNADFLDDAERLSAPTRNMVRQFEGKNLLIIDEAQRIEDIGLKMKVIFDTLPNLQIIATGSSAFELSNVVNEPLTGRYFSFNMYPISAAEAKTAGLFDMNNFLVFGSYPEVVTTRDNSTKQQIIQNIASNYLFKDVLNIEYIKNPRSLGALLKALAIQVGSEVSLNELSNTLDLDAKTVMSYLDILEKLCIIFPLKPFFSNKRKSISKLKKYYFYDLGVRNAVIDDFTPIESRKDSGALWENFCIVERMKRNDAAGRIVNYYFWRSYQNEEIDLIEVENEKKYGFEFKRKEQSLDKKIKEIYKQDLAGDGDLGAVYPDNFWSFGI